MMRQRHTEQDGNSLGDSHVLLDFGSQELLDDGALAQTLPSTDTEPLNEDDLGLTPPPEDLAITPPPQVLGATPPLADEDLAETPPLQILGVKPPLNDEDLAPTPPPDEFGPTPPPVLEDFRQIERDYAK